MEKLLILAEKNTAYQKFVKYLGGKTGTCDTNLGEISYVLTHAQGHLFELKDPQYQVDQSNKKLVKKYADWNNMDNFPWNLNDFKWEKRITKFRYKQIKKIYSMIKRDAKGCDGIIIATDDDPSGEGDVLGWEIVNAMHWNKKVYRIRFADETKPSFISSMHNITDVTDQSKQGYLVSGLARQRFDFASMQLSRIATHLASQNGYVSRGQAVKLGRLKSVILDIVYKQTLARESYKRVPFYEVRFKDEYGNVFLRKVEDDGEKCPFRFNDIKEAKQEEKAYHASPIKILKSELKQQTPPPLPDLGKLTVLVGKRNKAFTSKKILSVYQKMYEDGVVSYPRTEDKKITDAQFAELLKLKDKIAHAVNVDPKLLTHTTLRKKHRAEHAAHGANRPGINVPVSLNEVEKDYGPVGRAIYDVLAHTFLAILAENYVYTHSVAQLADFPNFVGSLNVPVHFNFRYIFNPDQDQDNKGAHFGEKAEPFIYEGANKKPSKPTRSFIIHYLSRHDIGTGATRVSTLSNISDGKNNLIKESGKKGYVLTNLGWVDAILAQNTFIANAHTTKQLFDYMAAARQFQIDARKIPFIMNQIVDHDKPTMQGNVAILKQDKHIHPVASGNNKKRAYKKPNPADYCHGTFQGKNIKFKLIWSGHKFSDQEVSDLLAGKEISFEAKSKRTGKVFKTTGKLAQQSFRGHSYYGFKPNPRK